MGELMLVNGGDNTPPKLKKNQIPAKQLQGVENPATVLLTPIQLCDGASWWSHDGILLGGIKTTGKRNIDENKVGHCYIKYLPIPIPRSWGEQKFNVVIEYEAENKNAKFDFRVMYGCGDPSELHLGETKEVVGKTGQKERVFFTLDESLLLRNELFRVTIDIMKKNQFPVLIYGAWLEIAV
jgi:hypothetical protein